MWSLLSTVKGTYLNRFPKFVRPNEYANFLVKTSVLLIDVVWFTSCIILLIWCNARVVWDFNDLYRCEIRSFDFFKRRCVLSIHHYTCDCFENDKPTVSQFKKTKRRRTRRVEKKYNSFRQSVNNKFNRELHTRAFFIQVLAFEVQRI